MKSNRKRSRRAIIGAYVVPAVFLLIIFFIGFGLGIKIKSTNTQAAEITVPEPVEDTVIEDELIVEVATVEEYDILAKLVWGEARGCSKTEQAAVIWCALNRLDDGRWGDSITEVVTAPYQFTGYRSKNPITDEHYQLAIDVLIRYEREKRGETNVGRVLPKDYLFFNGSDGHNWFRKEYQSSNYWDWDLSSPY